MGFLKSIEKEENTYIVHHYLPPYQTVVAPFLFDVVVDDLLVVFGSASLLNPYRSS
jgi:hypothetical protein